MISFQNYHDDDRLNRKELAELLGYQDAQSITMMTSQGRFTCPFEKVGRNCWYRIGDVKDWFAGKKVDPAARKKEVRRKARAIAA